MWREWTVAAVELRKLRKMFGKVEVLHGIDLVVEDGEFVVLVGPSGCGKSTLLRMVAGLESVTGGEVDIGGVLVNDLPPRDRDIAMVFQDYALYPHKTVAENMGFGLKMRGMATPDILERVKDAAEVLQIAHLLERRPGQLSGGQRQRVAMGRAIVRRPKVFLFDEPLSNLDAQLRAEVRIEIKKLHQRFGTTIIYVTHDQVEAMTLADRIAVLRAGHLEQFASPDDIYNRPASRFVAGFMGSPPMSFAKGAVAADGMSFTMPDGTLLPCTKKLVAGTFCEAGFRPEFVHLGTSGPVTAQARVEILEPLGAETLALIKVGGATLTGRFPPQAGVKPGDTVTVTLDTHRMQIFDTQTGHVLAA
jgi:multiple sugar transport system ATP-binding protein